MAQLRIATPLAFDHRLMANAVDVIERSRDLLRRTDNLVPTRGGLISARLP